jgi:hypothetical protein
LSEKVEIINFGTEEGSWKESAINVYRTEEEGLWKESAHKYYCDGGELNAQRGALLEGRRLLCFGYCRFQ